MTFYFPNKPIRVYNPDRLVSNLKPIEQWVAQPKWDGKRAMVSCSEDRVLMCSREGRPWGSKEWAWLAGLPLPQPWFLDSELLRDGRLFVWDFAVLAGVSRYRLPYHTRLNTLKEALTSPIENQGLVVSLIETMPAVQYQEILSREGSAHLEGFVWKDLNATDLWGPNSTSEVSSQLKFRFK